jgi:hypothetical protein
MSTNIPTNILTFDCIAFRCASPGDTNVVRPRPGTLFGAVIFDEHDGPEVESLPGPTEPGFWGWVDTGSDLTDGKIEWLGEWVQLTADQVSGMARGILPWD